MSCQFIFEAIGTKWQIDVPDALSKEREGALFEKIKARIAIFDKTYSRFRADSTVTAMSLKAGAYTLPDDAEPMLSLYKALYELTGGLFTPLIGQVLVDAGYDAEYSLTQKKALSKPLAWDEVMSYEKPVLTMKKPALLDFGAAGKGYLIDIVGELLEKEGIEHYCIDAGGDMLCNAPEKPLRVGLEDPDNFSKVIGVATVEGGAFCGSAGNRRAWRDFHHIIDPEKLSSPRHISALWTKAETTMLADAIATCLFFVSPEVLSEHYDFEYLILNVDRSVIVSDDFPGEVFTL